MDANLMVRDGIYWLSCLIAGAESRSNTVPNHTNELVSVVEHYQLHTVFETSYSVPHTELPVSALEVAPVTACGVQALSVLKLKVRCVQGS